MSRHPSPRRISRRTLLGAAGAFASAVAVAGDWAGPVARATAAPADVRVSSDGFGFHAEPHLAVNPVRPANLLAAGVVGPTGQEQTVATYASFDAGRSWRSSGAATLPAGTSTSDFATVAFDRTGRGYVCATATGEDPTDRSVYLWRSDDGGRTFSEPAALTPRQYVVHPWIAADHTGGLHVAFSGGHNTTLGYTRAPDAGIFEAVRTIQGPDDQRVDAPMVVAGPDGLVCAVYGSNADPASGHETVRAVASTDGGATFGAPVDLGDSAPWITLPGNVVANGSSSVAAAPRGRTLYAAYATQTPGTDHSAIAVSASYDGGATWSRAATATPPDAATVYFQPELAVDARGRILLLAFALADGLIDAVLLVSPSPALRFGAPMRLTPAPFDPSLAGNGGLDKHGIWWIGDYQGVAAAPDAVHALWTDTRTGGPELFTAAVPIP